MRAEEKEVDDRDLARAEALETTQEQDEEQLPGLVAEVEDAALVHRDQVVAAIRAMLAGTHVKLAQLDLPRRELIALEYLDAVVAGKEPARWTFAYAEDRSAMFEQALAVLEPVIASGDFADFADITTKVAELRTSLTNLGDAQDELLIDEELDAKEATEVDDKPKPQPDASLFDGPDVPAKQPAKTTLLGPDVPAKEPAKTTLLGPEVPDLQPAKTTLLGPDLPAKPSAASTLYGPDVPAKEPAASTAFDPADAPVELRPRPTRFRDDEESADESDPEKPDEPKKKSWWRRPFG